MPELLEIQNQRRELTLNGRELTSDLLLPAHPKGAVVLAHGKINDLDHPSLVAASLGAAWRGWAALRFNFPYRQEGREEPDPFPEMVATHLAACRWLADELPPGLPLVPAGKSLGSRTALAVTEQIPSAGLIVLGYPLHSSRNRRVRPDEPLASLRLPLLIVQGQRDPLARPELLESVLNQLPGPVRYWQVPEGNHSFEIPGGGEEQEEIWRKISRRVGRFLQELAAQN